MSSLNIYIPMDRRVAMAHGQELPNHMHGTALFADISGFTQLTEALAQLHGSQRGAEEITHHINLVFDSLIAEVDRYGGSVVGFGGDAITCWFDGDEGLRGTTCALAMHRAIEVFDPLSGPSGRQIKFALKAAVVVGSTQRFLVGDPNIRVFDVLAGSLMDELAAAEHHTQSGEVVLAPSAISALGQQAIIDILREEEETGQRFGVLSSLASEAPADPWPPIDGHALEDEQLLPWIPTPIYDRLKGEQSIFLAELRTAVSLFLRFSGIDYDDDISAREKLDSFIRWVQSILARYEGMLIDLTIGDKGSYLQAGFGVSLAHEDDPARAVTAASDLQNLPPELNFIREPQIGISQGLMRTGAYGATTRSTFGVQGSDVNLAARLMTSARPGQILITSRVSKAISPGFQVQELGPRILKGQQKPIPIFTVTKRRLPQSSGAQEARVLPGIIGRADERAILANELKDLLEGGTGCVLIEGEAGIGKSRLVEDFLHQTREMGVTAYLGAGDSIEQATTYFGWRSIYSALFELSERDDPAAVQNRILAQLAEDQYMMDRAPLLNAVLPIRLPENDLTAQMTGELRASNTQELLVSLLARSAERAPFALVIDDAHWLDSASWALLEQVRTQIRNALLLIATRPFLLEDVASEPQISRVTRPAEYDRLHNDPTVERIHLDRLDDEDILALISQRLGVSELPQPLAELILERAEGHPFFSEEIVLALRDAGTIRVVADQVELTSGNGDFRSGSFPDTIQGVITSRLDRLPAQEVLTLKVASVIGRIFPFQTLAAVHPLNMEGPQLRRQLDDLDRLAITPMETPEPNLAYIFRHILTQEVVYQMMLYAQRQQLHQAVAGWLEQVHADNIPPFYPLLAEHWRIAAEIEEQDAFPLQKAVFYLDKSGEQAERNYANQEVIRFLGQALIMSRDPRLEISTLQQARWHRKLGEAHLALGNLFESQNHLEQCVALLGRPSTESRVHLGGRLLGEIGKQILHRIWPGHFVGRKLQAGERYLEVARAYERLGFLYYFSGNSLALLTTGLLILNLSETGGLASVELAGAYSTNSYTAGLMGFRSLAEGYHQKGMALAHEIDHLPILSWVQVIWGNFNLGIANWEKTEESFQAVNELARHLGDLRRLQECLTLWGMAHYYQGNFDSAFDLAAETYTAAARSGNLQGKVWARFGQAGVHLPRAEFPEANAAVEEGLRLLEQVPDRLEQVRGYGLLARLRLYQGQNAPALEAARKTSELIGGIQLPTGYYLLEGYIGAAEVYLRLWEQRDFSLMDEKSLSKNARQACRALHRFAFVFPIGQPYAWLWQGCLERQMGRSNKARKSWEKGLSAAKRLKMPYASGLIHAEIGNAMDPGQAWG
ncbi:MAG TPA: AAA family ATPase, partial [Anaerolineales bacterium]|nr:AAA family ATPase [Anaerolineales bacterium]